MKLRGPLKYGDKVAWTFRCPGCDDTHFITSSWTFNGDKDRPTFNPSVVVTYNGEDEGRPVQTRCHFIITSGRIECLSDSTHGPRGEDRRSPRDGRKALVRAGAES
jgi:hypothetical protein